MGLLSQLNLVAKLKARRPKRQQNKAAPNTRFIPNQADCGRAALMPAHSQARFGQANLGSAQAVRRRPVAHQVPSAQSVHPVIEDMNSTTLTVDSGIGMSVAGDVYSDISEQKRYGVPGRRLIGYVPPAHKFEQNDDVSDPESVQDGNIDNFGSEQFGFVGFYAPREHKFHRGHVEPLENYELKRSNAVREKPNGSETFTPAPPQVTDRSPRPFSWQLQLDEFEPLPSESVPNGLKCEVPIEIRRKLVGSASSSSDDRSSASSESSQDQLYRSNATR